MFIFTEKRQKENYIMNAKIWEQNTPFIQGMMVCYIRIHVAAKYRGTIKIKFPLKMKEK